MRTAVFIGAMACIVLCALLPVQESEGSASGWYCEFVVDGEMVSYAPITLYQKGYLDIPEVEPKEGYEVRWFEWVTQEFQDPLTFDYTMYPPDCVFSFGAQYVPIPEEDLLGPILLTILIVVILCMLALMVVRYMG